MKTSPHLLAMRRADAARLRRAKALTLPASVSIGHPPRPCTLLALRGKSALIREQVDTAGVASAGELRTVALLALHLPEEK